MSILFMDGFDSYGLAADWTPASLDNYAAFNSFVTTLGYSASAGVIPVTDTRHGYGHSLKSGIKDPALAKRLRLPLGLQTEIVVGFAYKYRQTNRGQIISFYYDDHLGAVEPLAGLYANADGGISFAVPVNRNAGLYFSVGASNAATLRAVTPQNTIFPDSWQYIEVKYKPHKTAGSISVRVNGQTCLTLTGATVPPYMPDAVNTITLGTATNDLPLVLDLTTGDKSYDDLYVLNTSGADLNNFLGDVMVQSIPIVSDATPNELSQYGGSSGHFTAVNAWPPDEDVSYLYGNTPAEKELFGIDTLPANIIDVLAMSVHVRARKDAPGASSMRLIAKYSSSTVEGTTYALSTNYVTRHLFLEACPDTTAWTKVKAQAALFGFEVIA